MEKTEEKKYSPTLTTRSGAYAAGMVLIKEATKQGYKIATEGDGINISNRMKYQRGNVQLQSIQTITTSGGNDRAVVIDDSTFVSKHYNNFKEKNGYIPEMFNPYNEKEIKDIAPTQSTQCGSTTSSATILIKENKWSDLD
jgi:hypothetical protein